MWLHPDYRGYGLAKPFFAAAAQILQRYYPHLSLYVNDYNARALAMYRGTGWEQIGQFSTIILSANTPNLKRYKIKDDCAYLRLTR